MSPSKKANKKVSSKKTKNAQKRKSSARSSRVQNPTNKVKATRKKSLARSPRVKTHVRVGAQSIALTENIPTTQPPVETLSKGSSFQTNVFRVLALIAVIGISYFVFSISDRVEEFEQYGYIGAFAIALIANATLLLPAPGAAFIIGMGASPVFNPLMIGLAAGTGGAFGELSGYLAGFSGQAVIERTDIYDRIKPWVDKYGGWAILVLSAIPNPVFDVAGIAAGIAKMPMRTFLFFVWIGQLIKMTMFAYAGRYSLEWLAKFLN